MTSLFAEREGFEPPDLLQSTVFKTAAFDRSAISLFRFQIYNICRKSANGVQIYNSILKKKCLH